KTPILGVIIKVVGTSTITQSNDKGFFTIKANQGQALTFTSIGFETQKVVVKGNESLTINLKSQSTDLEEVTVVMDLQRKPRELGFSAQKVDGAEIQETQRENFVNSLQGRVAGLTVTSTNGQAGASSSIVLRGFNSMALSNQPLFVIDGIIIDNQTVNETSNGGSQLGLASDRPNRNNDYTNRVADINPNDIASVTVLKGPEATALYGSQASSGAIIISTKKPKADGKVAVAYDNSFRISDIKRFPNTINTFSPGTNGQSDNVFTYFGPAYTPNTKLYDNVTNFFQTGFAQTHNISLEYGKTNSSFRMSGSFFDQNGVVPKNNFKRYNVRLTNTTKVGKWLDFTPSLSLISSSNDKPIRGAGGYLLNLLIWPDNNDVTNYLTADGKKLLLYGSAPNAEFDNPYFNVNFNRSNDKTNRFIGTMGVNVRPTSWLTLTGRFGYDTYRSTGFTFYHPLSFLLSSAQGGMLDNYYRNYYGYNHTLTATARKNFGKFTTRLMVGNMYQDYKTKMFAVNGIRLKDSTSTDSSNTDPASRVRLSRAALFGDYNYSVNRQVAFFGEFAVSYGNFLFLTYSHRFENSSIFPADYRKYNYPAGSVSLIVSDLLPGIKKGGIVSYFKLRTSLAQTARSSAPYANQSVFNPVFGSGGGYAYAFNNNNFFLEPETQKTQEFGAEFKLFNNKVNFDITYYNTLNEKQIAENFRASYSTGFVLNTLNVGSTRNKGLEIAFDITPVQTKNFSWNLRLNFNKMTNQVESLPGNVPEFYISDTWLYANARAGLVKGGPTTSITAFGYARNNAGAILIDPTNGLPVLDQNFTVRGDRNPNFTMGIVNSFKYKSWSLNFLWDWKNGGDIFNATDMYLTRQGKSARTADRLTPRIVTGVLNDGLQNSANPTKNTITILPYNNQFYYTGRMPEEEFIEKNISWFRLRDLTLNYNLPAKTVKKLGFVKSLGAFVTCNDLVLITNYTGADPSGSGTNASTRGVGAAGFDYGNIATPIAVNFGVRANF
ncbi:MAG: SusC/RagA family TonB-linked outer membrane protein, partial [Deinococcales bacterium]|nr:SusC/RagA family TonB-linked outer membrane protein [Chitinophagaceae bacterium]